MSNFEFLKNISEYSLFSAAGNRNGNRNSEKSIMQEYFG